VLFLVLENHPMSYCLPAFCPGDIMVHATWTSNTSWRGFNFQSGWIICFRINSSNALRLISQTG